MSIETNYFFPLLYVLQEKSELKKNVDVLLEMFPCCSLHQAENVLSMAKGNLEDAVHIIVDSEGQFDNASETQVSPTNCDRLLHQLLICRNKSNYYYTAFILCQQFVQSFAK